MFSFNSGQLGGFTLNLSSILHLTKQNSKNKLLLCGLKFSLSLFFFFKSESSDCAQRGSDRRERADVERQTGPKPDLFVGKAVETAADVKWKELKKKKKKAKQQQQKELIAKRRQPITFRV